MPGSVDDKIWRGMCSIQTCHGCHGARRSKPPAGIMVTWLLISTIYVWVVGVTKHSISASRTGRSVPDMWQQVDRRDTLSGNLQSISFYTPPGSTLFPELLLKVAFCDLHFCSTASELALQTINFTKMELLQSQRNWFRKCHWLLEFTKNIQKYYFIFLAFIEKP